MTAMAVGAAAKVTADPATESGPVPVAFMPRTTTEETLLGVKPVNVADGPVGEASASAVFDARTSS